MATEGKIRWLPLESNPDVMTKYVRNLGIEEPWFFTDVFGLEPELLAMVPRPVLAVLLLYPLSDNVTNHPLGEEKPEPEIYFAKQTIGNACGTMGIIHAIANNLKKIKVDDSKHFIKFYEQTKDLTPLEKAQYLETDTVMGGAHEETAQEGQTEAPSKDDLLRHHFVSFVNHGGDLYELDGRRDAPLHHGTTCGDTLLEDAVQVVKKFIERDSEETGFSVIALCKAD